MDDRDITELRDHFGKTEEILKKSGNGNYDHLIEELNQNNSLNFEKMQEVFVEPESKGENFTSDQIENFANQLFGHVHIGKVDLYSKKSLKAYRAAENWTKMGMTDDEFNEIVEKARNKLKSGLEGEQVATITIMRNLNSLDRIETDLDKLESRIKFYDATVAAIAKRIMVLEKVRDLEERVNEGPVDDSMSKRITNEILKLYELLEKHNRLLDATNKSKSMFYKNIGDVMKNQIDLNYKLMTVQTNQERNRLVAERNDLLREQLRIRDPGRYEEDAMDADYTDATVEQLHEQIQLKLRQNKGLLPKDE